jgi:hypothetical protein
MPSVQISLTASQAAKSIGIQVSQLQHQLDRLGIEVVKGKKYKLRDIFKALTGDLQAEKAREVRLRSDHLELQIAAQNEDLVSMDRAKEMVTSMFLPVRQRLLSLPEAMAARVNPTDPVFARMALEEWVETSFQLLYEGEPDSAPVPSGPGKVTRKPSRNRKAPKPPADDREAEGDSGMGDGDTAAADAVVGD